MYPSCMKIQVHIFLCRLTVRTGISTMSDFNKIRMRKHVENILQVSCFLVSNSKIIWIVLVGLIRTLKYFHKANNHHEEHKPQVDFGIFYKVLNKIKQPVYIMMYW